MNPVRTCVLILDNLRSVENTASIFRTAEALGVKKIYCIGTTPTPLDRFGRKREDFAKVSLGAEKIDWQEEREIEPVIQRLKDENFWILALEQASNSKKPGPKSGNIALVVGGEVLGIGGGVLEMVDEVIEIPMLGHKESLNVSVATGIALYELLK